MKDPTENIGAILRKIRQEKGLTLDEASKVTDVSKAMLGQIERGESKPSISLLWKISTGLKVSISELLKEEEGMVEEINIDGITPIYEDNNKVKLYNVFPFDPTVGFEYFYITMQANTINKSSAHRSSTQEYVIVTEGSLVMKIEDKEFELVAPAAIKFNADIYHEYINKTDGITVFQNIVNYK